LTLKAPPIDSSLSWRSVVAGRLDNAPAGQELSAYTLHDVFVSYQPSQGLLDGLRLDLGVTNLFDETYERTSPGAYEEGRSFRAGVSYTLKF
jgi:hemoglobin/transferrin/lactoferrin receptor protein